MTARTARRPVHEALAAAEARSAGHTFTDRHLKSIAANIGMDFAELKALPADRIIAFEEFASFDPAPRR